MSVDWTSEVMAIAAVVQAVGAIAAIAYTVSIARAADRRAQAAEQAAERRAQKAEEAADDRAARNRSGGGGGGPDHVVLPSGEHYYPASGVTLAR